MKCAIGRTFKPYNGEGAWTASRSAQGRCVAFLVAWLRFGTRYEDTKDDRDKHFEDSKCRLGDAVKLASGDSVERLTAREYVESSPALLEVRGRERQPRADEPLEPLGKI